jgi:hypothetical protein
VSESSQIENLISQIEQLENNENNIRFSQLIRMCEQVFGGFRVNGSHHIFKTPWQGDPRINLQKIKGNRAKPYQVQQVLRAFRKLVEVKK